MNLEQLRNQIDQLDNKMMELFKKRMEVSKSIGQYKKNHHLAIIDQQREDKLISAKKEHFSNDSLWPLYEEFIKHMIDLSKRVQK